MAASVFVCLYAFWLLGMWWSMACVKHGSLLIAYTNTPLSDSEPSYSRKQVSAGIPEPETCETPASEALAMCSWCCTIGPHTRSECEQAAARNYALEISYTELELSEPGFRMLDIHEPRQYSEMG